jgi:F-type H+-transporting ATPase subunit gamma
MTLVMWLKAKRIPNPIDRLGISLENRTLLAVGLRAAGRLEDSGQPVEETFSVPGSTSGITPLVQELLWVLETWPARGIERVGLYFSEHLSAASYRPESFLLLPIDEEWLARVGAGSWPGRCLPLFTMDWDRLFSRLIRQYLFVSLYRAFAESLASENASRLSSMQGAERNIEEMLSGLHGHFHRQRQMSITEELLDIVSGYEALADPANRAKQ